MFQEERLRWVRFHYPGAVRCCWLTGAPQDSSTAVCTLGRSTRTFPERQVSAARDEQVHTMSGHARCHQEQSTIDLLNQR